jgi:hypothetical protein
MVPIERTVLFVPVIENSRREQQDFAGNAFDGSDSLADVSSGYVSFRFVERRAGIPVRVVRVRSTLSK